MAVSSLSGMKPVHQLASPEEQDKKLRNVSSLYEKQFLGEMLKAMRGTVQESGLVKTNQAEKIFQEQLDGEYVQKWADKGGIGLSDLIYHQLIDKYGAKLGITNSLAKPKGPLALGENANFSGRVVNETNDQSKKVTYRFDRQINAEGNEFQAPGLGASLGANALKAPWDGVLLGTKRLGAEEFVTEIQHADGLKSQFVFRGIPSSGLSAGPIQAGQNIGVLSPEAKSFFWTVENGPKSVSE